MSDKKLTDEEIIKALECCISTTTEEACAGCPFNKQKLCDKDQWALERYALDLINRQKAEIEKMKECPKCVYEYDGEVTEYCVQGPCPNFKTVEQIKAEAYKEFAENLEEKLCDCRTVSDGEYCGFDCGDIHQTITNLLKKWLVRKNDSSENYNKEE